MLPSQHGSLAQGVKGRAPDEGRVRAAVISQKYIDQVLQPGEHIEYQARLHPIVFLDGALTLAVGIAAATAFGSAGWLLVVIGLFLLLFAWIKRQTTEIAVTSRRVIYKTGLIRRDTIEMNKNKIESVDVSQSMLGRMLDFGTVTVRGTGMGIEPIRKIGGPLQFRRFVTAD